MLARASPTLMLSESAILGFGLEYQPGSCSGGESVLCCSRTLERKPLAVFFSEIKMVKKAQEPRGDCRSLGNSWMEEGLICKYGSPSRGRFRIEFRAPCISGSGPEIPTWKPEAGSRGASRQAGRSECIGPTSAS